jgi:hypothetical protein
MDIGRVTTASFSFGLRPIRRRVRRTQLRDANRASPSSRLENPSPRHSSFTRHRSGAGEAVPAMVAATPGERAAVAAFTITPAHDSQKGTDISEKGRVKRFHGHQGLLALRIL